MTVKVLIGKIIRIIVQLIITINKITNAVINIEPIGTNSQILE